MVTQSFFEDLVLRTPEAVANLEKAIDDADRRGPLKLKGAKGICHDPEVIRRFMEEE